MVGAAAAKGHADTDGKTARRAEGIQVSITCSLDKDVSGNAHIISLKVVDPSLTRGA